MAVVRYGAALILMALMASAAPARAAGDGLARYRWKNRLLVAIGASKDDPALAEQRRVFTTMASGAHERDLVLVEAFDGTPDGDALRRRFGGIGFRAVLVGKDGGEKLASARPLGPGALFSAIDAMPMRRDEIGRRP